MLSPAELKEAPIFSCLEEADLLWVSRLTADLHLEPGEYVIQEGEFCSFFALIEV
jgi:thioredoxin reductase (NADPH)